MPYTLIPEPRSGLTGPCLSETAIMLTGPGTDYRCGAGEEVRTGTTVRYRTAVGRSVPSREGIKGSRAGASERGLPP
jgi:hypothetical protein